MAPKGIRATKGNLRLFCVSLLSVSVEPAQIGTRDSFPNALCLSFGFQIVADNLKVLVLTVVPM